jgi:tetratricopeptide (TPR) repeat protein
LLAFSAAVTLTLIVGGAVFSFRLHAASGLAELRRRQAEANFQKAFEAVNRMLSRVGGERLVDVPEMEDIRREVLADALDFLKDFLADRGGDDPVVRREVGLAHQQMAAIHTLLGRYDLARHELGEALIVQSQLASAFPDVPHYRRELASSHVKLAGLEAQELTASFEGEAHFRVALTLLERLAREEPTARGDLMQCLHDVAALLRRAGREEEADGYTLRARTLLEELARDDPAAYGVDVARRDHDLGQELQRRNRPAEAEAAYRRCLNALRPLAGDHHGYRAYRMDLAECLNSLGNFLAHQDRNGEAEAVLKEALAIREQVARQYPLVPSAQDGEAYAQHALAWLYARLARNGDAEAAYLKAIAIRERLVDRPGAAPVARAQLAESCQNLGVLYRFTHRPGPARVMYDKAEAALRPLSVEYPNVVRFADSLATLQINQAGLLQDEGRPREALLLLDPLVDAVERPLGSRPISRVMAYQRGSLYGTRAHVNGALGRHDAAIGDWGRLIELTPPAQREPYILQRCFLRIRAGQFEQAAAEVDGLAARSEVAGATLYNCACVHALIAGAADSSSRRLDDRGSTLARSHSTAALALLVRARRAGFLQGTAGYELLDDDHDLDVLRSRADFQAFVWDLIFPSNPFAR